MNTHNIVLRFVRALYNYKAHPRHGLISLLRPLCGMDYRFGDPYFASEDPESQSDLPKAVQEGGKWAQILSLRLESILPPCRWRFGAFPEVEIHVSPSGLGVLFCGICFSV